MDDVFTHLEQHCEMISPRTGLATFVSDVALSMVGASVRTADRVSHDPVTSPHPVQGRASINQVPPTAIRSRLSPLATPGNDLGPPGSRLEKATIRGAFNL